MIKKIFFTSLIALNLASCDLPKKTIVEDPNIILVKNQFHKLPTVSRVEVRSFLKNKNHRYQKLISEVKKIKIKLDNKSDKYIEINFFTNEESEDAVLVTQFLLFNDKTKELITEQSINLK